MLVDKISNHNWDNQDKSIVKLQSFCRGFLAKTKAEKEKSHHLTLEIFEKAKPYVDNPSSRKNLPKAANGKTEVYLPKELPVVLKHSGFPENQKRFAQMKLARNLCIEFGYEHLIIPPARVYGDFIIESRVPIKANKFKEQMGLYIENWEKFTPAVKDFLGFYFHSFLGDITGMANGYDTLCKSPIGRYDNVALFLNEDLGKIGLIDLEHFSRTDLNHEKREDNFYFIRCLRTICLFPLHFDLIMDEAIKIDPSIEVYRQRLMEERDESLKRFKIAYEDHADFIKEKGITIQNPLFFEKLSEDRMQELKNLLEMKIKKVHEGKIAYGCYSFKDCLGEDPGKTLTEFHEKVLPYFVDGLYTLINFTLELNMKRYKDSADYTPGLLLIRSLELSSGCVRNKMVNPMCDLFSIFKMTDECDRQGFINWLLDITLKNMVGKEIAYYNSHFGLGSWATQCVFC